MSTSSVLQQAFAEAAGAGRSHVIVDLDGLTFMDASTLSALEDARRRILDAGGTLEIRCQPHFFRRLLVTGGLDNTLNDGANTHSPWQ